MILALLLIFLPLVGCATPQQTVVKVPKEVLVPIPVPCKGKADKPDYILDDPRVLNLPLLSKCAAMLGEVEQREAYEKELESILRSCEE
jgi:hypothetical protein